MFSGPYYSYSKRTIIIPTIAFWCDSNEAINKTGREVKPVHHSKLKESFRNVL